MKLNLLLYRNMYAVMEFYLSYTYYMSSLVEHIYKCNTLTASLSSYYLIFILPNLSTFTYCNMHISTIKIASAIWEWFCN